MKLMHKSLHIILIILIKNTINSDGLSLDEFGYYKNLVVAIDDRTVQNDVQNYTDIMKMGVQDLSDLLYNTTNGRFSIQNVEILVPDHWNVEIDGTSTFQFYEGADFKISHTFSLPFVQNPNPCGFPGREMQLPYSFFYFGDSGSYGRLGKALLSQFARLRFGVWEEHGFPGDIKFPYYWKPLLGTEWEVNTCTDAPIEGVYKNIYDGTPCGPDPDDVDNLYPPPSDCRFFPNTSQTAKSSLMSYHYLPTFEAFCNFDTHDRTKPTPQNYYCRHKSVMEVIESTPDWKTVTEKNTPGLVKFTVVKKSTKPMLYILLDSGFTQVPAPIQRQIASRLSSFIESGEMRSIVAGLGEFPSKNPGQTFTEVIPWAPIGNHSQEFVTAFHTTFGAQPGFKDYAGALRELLLSFNKRKHSSGAAILIVKMSSEPNTGGLTLESQVMIPLLLANVKVFAVEAYGSPIHSGNALERVVEKSEGLHLTISEPSDLLKPFDDFLTELTTTLQTPFTRSKKYVVGMDEMVLQNGAVGFKSNSRITQFELFAMPLAGEFTDVKLLNWAGNYINVTLQEMKWDSAETVPNVRKNFYFSSPEEEEPLDSVRWQRISIGCSYGPCIARVAVLLQVEEPDLIPKNIKLTVTTSAINGIVDFSEANASSYAGAAFTIYAKLEQDGIPFQSTAGLVVTAVISSPSAPGTQAWSVQLKDDGSALPDMTTNDGIFSGDFLPDAFFDEMVMYNGMYEIFVTATFVAVPTTTTSRSMHDEDEIQSFTSFSSIGRLFPVDQIHIGCGSGYLGCWSKIPEENFFISSNLENAVEFANFQLFEAVPSRIMDLVITPLANNNLNLQWTAPRVRDPRGHAYNEQADFYEIRHQDEIDKLLFDFDHAENLPAHKLPTPLLPGSRHNVTYDFGREASRYYAIRTIATSSGVAIWSQMSVIVGVNIKTALDASTTTTTTTTIRPTTITTLPPRTTSPGSTTTEADITSTTIMTSTTPNPNSTPSTGPSPSPQPSTSTPTDPPATSPSKSSDTVQSSVVVSLIGIFGAIFINIY